MANYCGQVPAHFNRGSFLTASALAAPLLQRSSSGAALLEKTTEFSEIEDAISRRSQRAYKIRREAAAFYRQLPIQQQTNGDEQGSLARFLTYSKGLPHNELGEVSAQAYGVLLGAVRSESPSNFNDIPLGGSAKLANPQAAFAFDLQGYDSHQTSTRLPLRSRPSVRRPNWSSSIGRL